MTSRGLEEWRKGHGSERRAVVKHQRATGWRAIDKDL